MRNLLHGSTIHTRRRSRLLKFSALLTDGWSLCNLYMVYIMKNVNYQLTVTSEVPGSIQNDMLVSRQYERHLHTLCLDFARLIQCHINVRPHWSIWSWRLFCIVY